MQLHGHLLARDLELHHIQDTVRPWRNFAAHTKNTYAKCLRRFIRWIEQVAGTQPTLNQQVPRYRQPAPRTVTATDDERALLLKAASPALRWFLLLCADLGLRHRTAASICPANYDRATNSLTFITKGNVQQTLPVTPDLKAMLITLPPVTDPHVPIVNLLRRTDKGGRIPGPKPRFTKQWQALKRRCGVRPELRIHDLRRTVAEDTWHATHDLRAVQAVLGHTSPATTARYLANRLSLADLTPIIAQVQQLRARRSAQPAVSNRPMRATFNPCEHCPKQKDCTPTHPACQHEVPDA